MSDDTKELLAFSGLLVLWPIGMVALLCMTGIIAVQYFSNTNPFEALLIASAIAGIFNGAGFFVFMMVGRFVYHAISKFKGEEK